MSSFFKKSVFFGMVSSRRVEQEIQQYYLSIDTILRESFHSEEEVKLANALRKNPNFDPQLSFVALDQQNQHPVGYILFFPITLRNTQPNAIRIVALAPLAVLPSFQRQGIGKHLMKVGIEKVKEKGYDAIFVLGHTEYYSKEGFECTTKWNIACPFPINNPAHFMALECTNNILSNFKGATLVYPKEFYDTL